MVIIWYNEREESNILLLLQSTSLAHDEVSEDTVYTCIGHPLRKDIKKIAELMLNSPFNEAFKRNKIYYQSVL